MKAFVSDSHHWQIEDNGEATQIASQNMWEIPVPQQLPPNYELFIVWIVPPASYPLPGTSCLPAILFSLSFSQNKLFLLFSCRVPKPTLLLFVSWIFLPPESYFLSQNIKIFSCERWFLPKEISCQLLFHVTTCDLFTPFLSNYIISSSRPDHFTSYFYICNSHYSWRSVKADRWHWCLLYAKSFA